MTEARTCHLPPGTPTRPAKGAGTLLGGDNSVNANEEGDGGRGEERNMRRGRGKKTRSEEIKERNTQTNMKELSRISEKSYNTVKLGWTIIR